MREDEKFQIIWENAQKMPEMEKTMFYELERKKPVVGLLFVVFLFGGAGLIYGGKAVKGAILILADVALLAVLLTLMGFGPIFSGGLIGGQGFDLSETFGAATYILVCIILALYIYAAWDVLKTIQEYNERLYVTVFDRSPP